MKLQNKLRTRGVWFFTETMDSEHAIAFAQKVESLNYSALWLPETTGRDPFSHISMLLANTERLVFATGIVNIHHRHPGVTKQAATTLAEMCDNRFLLGLGVSHAPLVEGLRQLDYSKPLRAMRNYLTAMKNSPYTSVPPSEDPPYVLAALGPKMMELAAEMTDGAHPYWTTPEHTAQARELLGKDKMLCVEQKVAFTTDKEVAYQTVRTELARYINLPNYRNNWKRLGFSEEEIDATSDRFIDELVAWGTLDQINERLNEHEEAGASHICIQPLAVHGEFGNPHWEALEALSPTS
ncbi:MAG: LLM class F420-dependent oxidoreductase [Actinobacteria bacterium]|nr:LLM class F420-dependent oxidoreductase [Actinomycetota bacterium]|tara:strand:+ start:6971 stop:7858 length:888 start_codon:yes stop_codon:yes gene_type:complete